LKYETDRVVEKIDRHLKEYWSIIIYL